MAIPARWQAATFGHTCTSVQMSLLNCLCAAIPARERVITCEEVFELGPRPWHPSDQRFRNGRWYGEEGLRIP
jgi:Flp pilus assembly CpaF family ATPase